MASDQKKEKRRLRAKARAKAGGTDQARKVTDGTDWKGALRFTSAANVPSKSKRRRERRKKLTESRELKRQAARLEAQARGEG